MRQPVRVAKDPIATAIFEMRFDPTTDSIPDLMPGMLYGTLKDQFPRLNTLPFAEIPLPVKKTMPEWYNQSVKQMTSESGQVSLNIAHRALVVEVIRPYPGWKAFRRSIANVATAVSKLGLIRTVNRYSLRYQNVLSKEVLPDLSDLKVTVELADHNLEVEGFNLRSEINFEGTRTIVHVATGAQISLHYNNQQDQLRGTLVDVDSLMIGSVPDFFEKHESLIDELHEKEKRVFFSLLSDSVLDRLGPVWED